MAQAETCAAAVIGIDPSALAYFLQCAQELVEVVELATPISPFRCMFLLINK